MKSENCVDDFATNGTATIAAAATMETIADGVAAVAPTSQQQLINSDSANNVDANYSSSSSSRTTINENDSSRNGDAKMQQINGAEGFSCEKAAEMEHNETDQLKNGVQMTTEKSFSASGAQHNNNGVASKSPNVFESEKSSSIHEEICDIKKNLLFLNHQMMKLLKSFDVKKCECSCCEKTPIFCVEKFSRKRIQPRGNLRDVKHAKFMEDPCGVRNADAKKLSSYASPAPSSCANESDENTEEPEEDEEEDERVVDEDDDEGTLDAHHRVGAANNELLLQQHPLSADVNDAQLKSAPNNNAPTLHPNRGRKSKYCSASEKKAVAGYAQTHGATAAARKFNIPPAVAAYYHRKQFKSPKNFGTANEDSAFFPDNFNGVEYANKLKAANEDAFCANANVPLNSKTSEDFAPFHASHNSAHAIGCSKEANATSSNSSPINNEPQAIMAAAVAAAAESNNNYNNNNNDYDVGADGAWSSLEKSANHSGSPGFLRGRGRGRPKLIGDELDAELVEYMVQLKAINRQHLTASQALQIARSYIAEKSPGLLEEHGGQIKLKITWAMKLVSRIAEREREIQLGLPAGSLQNFGRTQPGNASKSLMDELISQNLFGQPNINGNLSPSLNKGSVDTQFQNYSRPKDAASISNVSTTTAVNWPDASTLIRSNSNSAAALNALSTAAGVSLAGIANGDASIYSIANACSAQSVQQPTMTDASFLMSMLNKFGGSGGGGDQMCGATAALAAAELFDSSALFSELGVSSVEELAQCEPLKSLLQASFLSTPHGEADALKISPTNHSTNHINSNAVKANDPTQTNGATSQTSEILVTSAF